MRAIVPTSSRNNVLSEYLDVDSLGFLGISVLFTPTPNRKGRQVAAFQSLYLLFVQANDTLRRD